MKSAAMGKGWISFGILPILKFKFKVISLKAPNYFPLNCFVFWLFRNPISILKITFSKQQIGAIILKNILKC